MLDAAKKCQCSDFPVFKMAKEGFSVECDTCGRETIALPSLEAAIKAWNEMVAAEKKPAPAQLAEIDSILRAYGWNGKGTLVDAVKALTNDANEMRAAIAEDILLLNTAFSMIEKYAPLRAAQMFGKFAKENMKHFIFEDDNATVDADTTARS